MVSPSGTNTSVRPVVATMGDARSGGGREAGAQLLGDDGPVVVGDRVQRAVARSRLAARSLSAAGRWWRSTPSNVAPIRSSAARLRALRASVAKSTRQTPHVSNACRRSRYLASVLIGVRCAVGGEPRAADLDLVGLVAAAPAAQRHEAGAAHGRAVGPALRERHGLAGVAGVEQIVDVAEHLVAPVGHPRVARTSSDRRRPPPPGRRRGAGRAAPTARTDPPARARGRRAITATVPTPRPTPRRSDGDRPVTRCSFELYMENPNFYFRISTCWLEISPSDACSPGCNGAPVVVLTGPRQAGKTTLARALVDAPESNFFDLEDPRDDARLSDPTLTLPSLEGTIVIDEAQRRQDLFPILRVLVDEDRRNGRFLVLGSASPDLVGLASESLAGRVALVELTGLQLADVGAREIDTIWRRGGLPLSYLADTDERSVEWREDYVRTFLERDLANLGFRIPATTMRRFWTMVAHYHGQTWNGAEIARSLAVSQPTVRRYLDALTDALVIRQLQPWHANIGKRQIRSPKVYIRDSGLLHRLPA
jgi:hypothetical protein